MIMVVQSSMQTIKPALHRKLIQNYSEHRSAMHTRVLLSGVVSTLTSAVWVGAARTSVLTPTFVDTCMNQHSRRTPLHPQRFLPISTYPRVESKMVATSPANEALVTGDGEWSDALPYERSAHNSATIIVPEEPSPLFERAAFREKLTNTCKALREEKKSSVWLEVPMSRAGLIEETIDLGFKYHHAQGDAAKLNLWLREDTESKVPEYATHHVGVGAVVVNSREEILCVRELRKNYMPWKVPGGLSELGESISDAAEREVMEETGVPTKFHSILSFRHTHGLANGRSDLYFVCRLDPIEEIDEDGKIIIPTPTAQECEIEATKWVPLSEYKDMVHGVNDEPGHPMMSNVMKVYDEGIRIKQKEVKSVVPGRKPNPLYMPVVTDP